MGGLISKPKAPPPPPPPPEPTPMPDPENPKIKRDSKRNYAMQRRKSGRASTILSQAGSSGEALGG